MQALIVAALTVAVQAHIIPHQPFTFYRAQYIPSTRFAPAGTFGYTPLTGYPFQPFFYNSPALHPYAGFPFQWAPSVPSWAPGQTFIPIIPGLVPLDPNNATTPATPEDVEPAEPTTPQPEKVVEDSEDKEEDKGDDEEEVKAEEPQSDDSVSVESE